VCLSVENHQAQLSDVIAFQQQAQLLNVELNESIT
jgi:hypothetical protein